MHIHKVASHVLPLTPSSPLCVCNVHMWYPPLSSHAKKASSSTWIEVMPATPLLLKMSAALQSSKCYVGFTAGTSSSGVQRHLITDWTFKVIGVGPNTISADVSSQLTAAGLAQSFRVTTKDACTNPVSYVFHHVL